MAKKAKAAAKKTTRSRRKATPREIEYTNFKLTAGGEEIEVDELSALMLFDKAFRECNLGEGSKPTIEFFGKIAKGLEDLGAKGVTKTESWVAWDGAFNEDFVEENDEYMIGGHKAEFIEVLLTVEEVEDAYKGKIGTVEFFIALARALRKIGATTASPADAYRVWRRTAWKSDQLKKST